MKSVFDILDVVYPIVNVATVTTLLDGDVYRINKPVDSRVRDITVGALTVTGSTDRDLQDCPIIINCYAPDILPGVPDNTRLDAMTAAVMGVIDGYVMASDYVHFEEVGQNVMPDSDVPGMTYSSIRYNCTVQKIK